ncbi:MAG: NAD-dependent epimerase/dehydratase family protein [Candidatus Micrarchaeia archaeon]
MKIALTGGAGFIGSNIAEKLIEKDYDLTVVDNFHTGDKENLEQVLGKINIVNSESGKFFEQTDEKFDLICHQGVYSSTPMYMQDHKLTSKIYDEFVSILEYARKNDIKKVVYASTSSIYNGHNPPQNEDMIPYITDFYTEGRYAMDRIGELYHKLYGINIVGLRYFSVYGPHEKSKGNYANLISQFLWAMTKNEEPVVYGDGTQTRDFTYVDDIANANILSLEKEVSGIFNVGTGKNITINEMIEILNKKLGKKLKPKYIINPIKNYVQTTLADTTKAEKELGFKAKITLEEGIERLIKYYGV